MAEKRSPEALDALVLTLLREADAPQTAYNLVEAAYRQGQRLHPAQIYRNLGRLIDHGLVMRIEALNAFIPHQDGRNVALLCRGCGLCQIVPDIDALSRAETAGLKVGFHPDTKLLELIGRCEKCWAATTGDALGAMAT